MKELLGLWMVDPESDAEQLVTLEFKKDGQLIYTVIEEDAEIITLLTYRIEGNIIISDQPSEPREEKTEFSFTNQGKLILNHDSIVRYYIRIPE